MLRNMGLAHFDFFYKIFSVPALHLPLPIHPPNPHAASTLPLLSPHVYLLSVFIHLISLSSILLWDRVFPIRLVNQQAFQSVAWDNLFHLNLEPLLPEAQQPRRHYANPKAHRPCSRRLGRGRVCLPNYPCRTRTDKSHAGLQYTSVMSTSNGVQTKSAV